MIAFTVRRPAINSAYEGLDLFRFQIQDSSPNHLLGLNGEDPAILARPRQVLPKEMLYETADGRQAAIARDGGNPTMRFDVVEEPQHSVRLDIIQRQVRDGLTLLLG